MSITPPPPTDRSVAWALIALAAGGFAIGTTEFVTMGLVEEIADGIDVSIPAAGHVISSYALGVVVGAPIIAYFCAQLPRRSLLVALMAVFAVGNAASAIAPAYGSLMAARFISGIPHGAYLGVAALVAASIAPRGRQGRAVAIVMLGLSISNVIGVPAATWLGQRWGWRSAYWVVTSIGIATVCAVALVVPKQPGNPDASGRRELSLFRNRHVVFALLVGAIGFGGMFALYSYVSPAVTRVGGLGDSAVPIFLLMFGIGMVAGTAVAGEIADRSMWGGMAIGLAGCIAALLAFAVLLPLGWWAIVAAPFVSAFSSVLVVNLQLRIMTIAKGAETLGSAMNHASLNIANALGAWIGGVVIDAGWGYRAPSVVGAGLSLIGLVVLAVAYANREPAESTAG